MTIERAKLFVSDEADRCRSLGQFQREKIAREALEAIVALEKRAEEWRTPQDLNLQPPD